MKTIAQQFALDIPKDNTRAPFMLDPETTEDRKPKADQPDLGDLLKLPPAQTQAEWLARLSPNLRAQVQRQRKGPVGYSEIDPVTGMPFAATGKGVSA